MTKKLLRQHDGASLVDYGILTGLISVLAIGAVFGTGTEIRNLFQDVGTEIAERRTGPGGPSTGTPGGDSEQVVEEEEEVVLPYVRAAGGMAIIDNGTSVSTDIPGPSEEGDLLVAFVTHRSALSASEGWQFEGTQRARGFDQWVSVFTKPFAPGDTNVSFSQSGSNRMVAHVVTVAGTDPRVANFVSNNGNSGDYIGPSYVVAGSESLSITARTEVYINNSGTTTIMPTAGWTLTTPSTLSGNRMGVAWNRETAGTEGTIVTGPALTDDAPSHDWGAVVVQLTSGGVAAPYSESFGPYDPYIDPLAFLMLTDDADTASVSGYPGVYAKAGNDTLNGTSSAETFIPGAGNDQVNTNGGDDIIVFGPGDGQDVIDPASGFETLILTNYASTDATLRGVNQGYDLAIYLPSDDQVYVVNGLLNASGALDAVQFSDGVTMNLVQMINKAADDGKPFGTVMGSRMDDYHFHTESVDGTYLLQDAGGADTLDFTETASADASFSINHLGYNLIIETPDGDRVTIENQTFEYSNTRMETISFSDGVDMDIHQQLLKALNDQKASGTVNFSRLNDSLTHTQSVDGNYLIVGASTSGTDSLTFSDVTSSDATFYTNGAANIMIETPDGDTITIQNYRYQASPWLETITFSDGVTVTRDQILANSTEWGTSLPAPG